MVVGDKKSTFEDSRREGQGKTMEWDFARSITSMRLMTELGAEHGLSVACCLAGTGVKESDLRDSTAVVTAQQELTLIRNLISQLGDVPGLGIEAGKRYHFTAFGALGFAMVSSPNALSALHLALRYFDLTFAFTKFHVTKEGDETHITLDDSGLPEDVRAFVVERDSAALMTVQRDLFSSRAGLRGAFFKRRAPPDPGLYEDFYGVCPQFGAAFNKAIMSTSALLEGLPQGNELALMAAEEQCKNLLDRHRARAGLSGRVRGILAKHTRPMPDMNEVSRALFITPRTLRRRLIEEGTTFVKLRDEVRLALAQEFLTTFSLSIEQIAERLSYSEPTCFINAFKRWTGRTPLNYRKNLDRTQSR